MTTHTVTTLRTGITNDGHIEIQLIYGKDRGTSLWFRLDKAQALKLAKEIWTMREESSGPIPFKQAER